MALVQLGLSPLLSATLPTLLGQHAGHALAGFLLHAYGVLWVLPAYTVSLLVNTLWYAELADLTVAAGQRQAMLRRAERRGASLEATSAPVKAHVPDVTTLLSEALYRSMLLAVITLQITVLDLFYLPGRLASAALMAWLYALYSFDYKWSAHGVPLNTRVAFFETHWAYFTGFGILTVLPVQLTSFFTGAAIIGVAFPLFIILAVDANPKQQQLAVMQANGMTQLTPLRVFGPASWMTNAMLHMLGGDMSSIWNLLRGRTPPASRPRRPPPAAA